MIYYLALLVLGRAADIGTTIYALKKGFKEKHPVTLWTMNKFGKLWWIVNLVISFTALGAIGAVTGDFRGAAIGLTLVSLIIAARNFLIIKKRWPSKWP